MARLHKFWFVSLGSIHFIPLSFCSRSRTCLSSRNFQLIGAINKELLFPDCKMKALPVKPFYTTLAYLKFLMPWQKMQQRFVKSNTEQNEENPNKHKPPTEPPNNSNNQTTQQTVKSAAKYRPILHGATLGSRTFSFHTDRQVKCKLGSISVDLMLREKYFPGFWEIFYDP